MPVRQAATVVLVRDAPAGGIEVFLQHRVDSMVFAPGMAVFPGGGVDEADRRSGEPWLGPGPQWWGEAFGVAPERAAAAVRAAIRELFEETGVLLAAAGSGGADPEGFVGVGGAAAPAWPERRQLVERTLGMDRMLSAAGLVADCRPLRPWDRWTTPVGPPRRYDTLFFLAVLPDGARPDGRNSESRTSGWRSPGRALADGAGAGPGLLPPTRAVLEGLAGVGRTSDLPSGGRPVPAGGR